MFILSLSKLAALLKKQGKFYIFSIKDFFYRRPLKKHIKDLLNQGYLKTQIMERLLGAGYEQNIINNIFADIEGRVQKEEIKHEKLKAVKEVHVFIPELIREKEKEGQEKIKFFDLFYLASRSFRTRASRTILTSLGVSIGFGTILVLVSLGYGLENILIKQLASSDALLSLSVIPTESVKLTPQKIEEISNFPEINETSPLAVFSSELALGEIASNTFVYAVLPSYFRLSAIKVKAGEVLKDDNLYSVVISSALMESVVVKKYEDILNKEIKLTLFVLKEEGSEAGTIELMPLEKTFKIIGVIDDPTISYLYLNLNFVKNIQHLSYREAKVKVEKSEYIHSVQEKVINFGFLSTALSSTVDQANKVFKAVQTILAIFGIVALLVSSIGMVNTMTITLLERINEIGIMKAVGATNSAIKKIFLTEAMIIAGAGGIGGVIIGILAQNMLNLGFNLLAKSLGGKAVDLFYQPSWFILALIIFPIVIGFFTGFLPANKASKIDPLKALRYK